MSEKRGAAEDEAPMSCQQCNRWKAAKESVRETRLMEVLGKTLDKIEEALKAETFKPTIGDYMKLVQMQKELDEGLDGTKEVRVRWVGPPESETEE